MGFKKGRKKTVRRLLRLAALFKAQSALSSTAGHIANTRPSAVVSEPSRGHCLPHGGRSINRRKTEHQHIAVVFEPSRGRGVPLRPGHGRRSINRRKTKHQDIAERNIVLLLFLSTCHLIAWPQVLHQLPHLLLHDVLCLTIADVSEPSKQHCKDTR